MHHSALRGRSPGASRSVGLGPQMAPVILSDHRGLFLFQDKGEAVRFTRRQWNYEVDVPVSRTSDLRNMLTILRLERDIQQHNQDLIQSQEWENDDEGIEDQDLHDVLTQVDSQLDDLDTAIHAVSEELNARLITPDMDDAEKWRRMLKNLRIEALYRPLSRSEQTMAEAYEAAVGRDVPEPNTARKVVSSGSSAWIGEDMDDAIQRQIREMSDEERAKRRREMAEAREAEVINEAIDRMFPARIASDEELNRVRRRLADLGPLVDPTETPSENRRRRRRRRVRN